jgi:hypothetical protein
MARVVSWLVRHPLLVLGSLVAMWFSAVGHTPEVKARKAGRSPERG